MGVSPSGGQVRTTEGIKRKPDSSANPMWAPSRAAFFYPGPVPLFPAFDFSFLPLQRASLGFLRGPFQAVHQATDVGAVIADSELPLDNLSNADRGPEIRPVTLRDRSSKEEPHQAFSLRRVQLPRTAWRETHPQGFRSATPPGITPAHHRTRIASDAPSRFVERVTSTQQRQSSPAPIFQQIGAPRRSGQRCSAS